MHTLSRWFKPGLRRTDDAERRLVQSYQAVFHGSPTKQDQEVVLSDLFSFGDLFTVAAPDEELITREGRRQVAYRILRFLQLQDAERFALFEVAQAAVVETLVNDNEGRI